RRAPDRIFVDELRALLARRICQRHPGVRLERDHLLGRVAAAVRLGAALLYPGHPLAVRQDGILLLLFQLGESDRAPLPLRPADAPGLEDLPAAYPDLRRARLGLADAHEVGMQPWVGFVTLYEFVRAHALRLKYFFESKPPI